MSPRRQPVEVEAAPAPDLLKQAADRFEARQSGADEPEGAWEDRVWLPSDRERRACCAELVPDKLKDPQKLRNHCRTLLHVANLFDLDSRFLRAELRRRREERGPAAPATAAVELRPRRARPARWAERTEPVSEEARALHATLLRLIDDKRSALDLLAAQAGEACQGLRQLLHEGQAVEVAIAESRAGDLSGDLKDLIDDLTQLVITRDTLRRVLR